jgi:DNA-binding transcriptional LysR family regulator
MQRLSNTNNLLAFVTVAREGSVSRAAEVLNLTQPAVSHQIKRLSDETGVQLFRRTAMGLAITPDGVALLSKAEGVLEAITAFHTSAYQRVGRISWTLRIGTIVDPEFIRLGPLLSLLRTEHPDLQPELKHGVSGDIPFWLVRGQIDAGFYLSGAYEPSFHDAAAEVTLKALRLAQFNYRIVGPAGWQDQIEKADWPTLARLPWIGTPSTSVHNRLLTQIFSGHDCAQNIVALVDQEASMLEMVRSGIGLSLCRDSIALHHKQVSGLAVCDRVAVPATLSVVTLADRSDPPSVSALFDLARKMWR